MQEKKTSEWPTAKPYHMLGDLEKVIIMYLACADNNRSLSMSMAGRAIFQMDKTASPNQGFLRHIRECREDSNLDCNLDLRPCSHSKETNETGFKSLHNFTDFKCQFI